MLLCSVGLFDRGMNVLKHVCFTEFKEILSGDLISLFRNLFVFLCGFYSLSFWGLHRLMFCFMKSSGVVVNPLGFWCWSGCRFVCSEHKDALQAQYTYMNPNCCAISTPQSPPKPRLLPSKHMAWKFHVSLLLTSFQSELRNLSIQNCQRC